jgi:hypothetical protein
LNKFWMVYLVAALLTGCNKSEKKLIADAKNAVQEKVVKDYNQNLCDNEKMLVRLNIKSNLLGSCDSEFKPSAGLTFSDINFYQHKDSVAVCGIVSGRTDIGRIGARFAYIEQGSNNYVFLQKSRYHTTESSKHSVYLLAALIRNQINEICQ